MKSLLDLCRSFINIDSRNSVGNDALASFAAENLRRLGFMITKQRARLNGKRNVNLIARIGPFIKRPLLINTHLDTVETEEKAWTMTGGDPLNSTIKRGRLYGLGSADTKLALACQLVALGSLDLKRLRRPLVITGTFGEEMGLVGVQKLIKSHLVKPQCVLNSEPTELVPSNGNYGFRVYNIEAFQLKKSMRAGYFHRISFRGKAAHSAVPEHGSSAIIQALEWLRKQPADTVVLGMNGGIAPNIIAPDCTVDILSSSAKVSGLRSFGGRSLDSEFVADIKVLPALSSSLRHISPSLLTMNKAKELTTAGKLTFQQGHYKILVSHRFAPSVSPDRNLVRWKKNIQALNGKGVHIAITTKKDNPAFRQKASCSFVKTVRGVLADMNKSTELILKPGCTEAMYFARLGCDVLTIGPGESYGNVHAPNESIWVKDLKEAVEFYRRIIERICM